MKTIDRYVFLFVSLLLVTFATIVEFNYGTFSVWYSNNQDFCKNFGKTISDLKQNHTISTHQLNKLKEYHSQGRMAYDSILQSLLNIMGHVLACFAICTLHSTRRKFNYVLMLVVAITSISCSVYEIYLKKEKDERISNLINSEKI